MMNKIYTLLLVLAFSFQVNAQEDELIYNVKHLDKVNTKYSDFGVAKYGDDIVFASSRKEGNKSSGRWKGNKQPFLDLFIASVDEDGELTPKGAFSEAINTKYHEATPVFTKDLKTVYFSRSNFKDSNDKLFLSTGRKNLIHMYKANIDANGKWTNIRKLPFNGKDFQTGHPTLNEDETKLYFTSDRPGSIGKTDIWVVDILGEDSYGEPVNLGKEVNSSVKEMFPYISKSGKLYFASEKGGGFGGLDIYHSRNVTENKFTEAVNIGEQINSSRDDFAFIINEDTQDGYFSSKRNKGKGDDDIYYFKIEEPEPVCDQKIQGIVRNAKTGKMLPGATVVLYDEDVELERMIVGNDARFEFALDCDKEYKVIGSKTDFESDTKTFQSKPAGEDIGIALTADLSLKPDLVEFVRSGDQWMIKINPIYFDYDKANIRADAERELEKVIAVMKRYPDIIIESGSHTDARGRAAYNQKLSARRAKSTVDFITRYGQINPDRISYRGYGEERLVNGCVDNDRHTNRVKCTQAEHQMNRRTEFVIVNPEVINR